MERMNRDKHDEDDRDRHMGHDDHVGDTTNNTDAMHHHNNHHPDHVNETDDGEVVPPPTDDAVAVAAEDATDPRHHHNTISNNDNSNMALRPLFFGNLLPNYSTEQITNLFEHPERFMDSLPPPPPVAMTHSSSNTTTDETTTTTTTTTTTHSPIPVDRIDMKRGYCFVFLKDATDLAEKLRIEAFCQAINGIHVPHVSRAIRAEFARGDGRVKRIEDERRKNIAPSDTLFVVNFHEHTTKKEDLELLFEPYGKLLRIDLKRNYAFVQFASVAEATAAREATNGGKLDQSVLTVEYTARQRDNNDNRHHHRHNTSNPNRGPPPPPRNRYPTSSSTSNSNNNYNSSSDHHHHHHPDRYRNDRDIRNVERGPGTFGGSAGGGGVGRYDDIPPSYYDDRGRDLDIRGRSEYRSNSIGGAGGDPYYNRATIYDNDRYSDRRANRDSPPPLPPPPVSVPASYAPYNNHVRGRSRSRSPPAYPRRRYPEEEEDRLVREDYRGVVIGSSGSGGGAGGGSSQSQYERRASGGGGGGSSSNDHYPRRSSSPSDRYRYSDRETRGYR